MSSSQHLDFFFHEKYSDVLKSEQTSERDDLLSFFISTVPSDLRCEDDGKQVSVLFSPDDYKLVPASNLSTVNICDPYEEYVKHILMVFEECLMKCAFPPFGVLEFRVPTMCSRCELYVKFIIEEKHIGPYALCRLILSHMSRLARDTKCSCGLEISKKIFEISIKLNEGLLL